MIDAQQKLLKKGSFLRLLKIKTRREINLKFSISCLDNGVHYTLVNTSNQLHLNFESIEYIGSDDDVSEELIVNIKFIDKRTGKTEETVIGYSFNKVDLNDYKVSNIGGMSPREMMDYYDHDILVELEYSNKNKEKFIEEIEVKPTWNFESNKTIGQNDNVRLTQLI